MSLHRQRLRQFWAFLLPRPLGLQHKGIFFWCGFVIAYPWAAEAFPADPNSLMNALLRGIVYFFVLEILVQQAKFLWNDVRDRSTDRDAAINQQRVQYSTMISVRTASLHILVRWTAGLVIGALLSPSFLLALILITLHQILYELVFKPSAQAHPVIYFAFLCFNLPLRVICGFLCFFDFAAVLSLPVLMITLLVFYLMSWSSLSSQMLTEAHRAAGDGDFLQYKYLRPVRWLSLPGLSAYWRTGDDRPPIPVHFPRGQSMFFYENGRRMAALALLPSILIVLLLGIGEAPAILRPPSSLVLLALLIICLLLTPVTVSDTGFKQSKTQWRHVLQLVIPLSFLVTLALGVLTLTTADRQWAMWYLIGYTFFHYLLYVDSPDFDWGRVKG
ncbi:MAG: hypothetical protein U0670_14080 [Anaerolineae bacterium]